MGLDVVELFMAFEEEFGITIPDADAEELTTSRKVTDYVVGKVAGSGVSREQVAARVRRVVEKQTASYDFSDDDHFVHDLHLD